MTAAPVWLERLMARYQGLHGMGLAALLAARVEELRVLPLIQEHPLGETTRVVIEAALARGE